MKKHGFVIYPENAHNLVGGIEEMLFWYCRANLGYKCYKQMNNPTSFSRKMTRLHKTDSGSSLHNINIINDNIGKYIRDTYCQSNWNPNVDDFRCEFPKLIRENHRKGIPVV